MLLSHEADINHVEDSYLLKLPRTGSALGIRLQHYTPPIWEAANAKDVDMVEFLLERGADPAVRTEKGQPGIEREAGDATHLLKSSIFDRLRQEGQAISDEVYYPVGRVLVELRCRILIVIEFDGWCETRFSV